MIASEIHKAILEHNLIVFHSDYGKKSVAESWSQRLAKQIKQENQFKDFQNVNLITGENNIVDIDLDCPEAIAFYRICEQDLLNEVTFSCKVLQEYGEKYRNQCPYSVEILPTGRFFI